MRFSRDSLVNSVHLASLQMQNPAKVINSLAPNEVFVYAANEAGLHASVVAKTAMQWGAKFGEIGFNGQTYGIPTKSKNITALSVLELKVYVDKFLEFAKEHPELIFLVTPIGTGLSGYIDLDIAPLFDEAIEMDNVMLPTLFVEYFAPKKAKSSQKRLSRYDLREEYD